MDEKKSGGIKHWYAEHSDGIKKVRSIVTRVIVFGSIAYVGYKNMNTRRNTIYELGVTAGNLQGTSETINRLLDANQDNPEVINAVQKCATEWFNVK